MLRPSFFVIIMRAQHVAPLQFCFLAETMSIFISIIAFLFAVSILALIHEYGHFLVARFFKIKVLKFSIGFGKPLFSWVGKNKTKYLISAIPLGGYVKMLDTREGEVAPSELTLAFDKKPILQRILVVLAGPLTNVIFTIFAFLIIFMIGIKSPKPIIGKILPQTIASQVGMKAGDEIIAINHQKVVNWQDVMLAVFSHIGEKNTLALDTKSSNSQILNYDLDLKNWRLNMLVLDPLRDLGIEPYHPNPPAIIDDIGKGTPAAKAGLIAKDKVISVDKVKVTSWDELVDYIKDHPQQKMNFVVKRQTQFLNIPVVADWRYDKGWKKIGFLGIKPVPIDWPQDYFIEQKYSLPFALIPAMQNTFTFLKFNCVVIGKLITGKISLLVLGGPISIFQSAASALNQGIIIYFSFLALLSLMLAFVNLLPIPGLDGGHVFFLILEGITKKPLSNATQILIIRLGLIFLALIMVQSTINDLMRLWH